MPAVGAALLAAVLAADAPATPGSLDLRVSLKSAALVQRVPDDPALFPGRETASALWRLRLDGAARPAGWVALLASWEQRLRVDSAGVDTVAGPLPAEAPAPYRLRPLDWAIASGAGLSWRHEVDRAAVLLDAGGGSRVTIGRQAIGWGRGVLFGAVDLFAPFTPLEVDREWRRGVDALRAEVALGEHASAELLAVGAARGDDMAAAGLVRGALGNADAELVAGWRAGDWLLGATSSAAAGDAEVHAELCAFRAAAPLPAGGSLGDPRLALKAVAGASNHFALGKGLYLLGESHHSGFGARNARDLAGLVADPVFLRRLLRGDTQIPGRWAAAATASYPFTEVTTASLTALVSPGDGSGAVTPQLRFDLGDALTVTASGIVPFGAGPSGGAPRSDYGATPASLLLQVAVYR
jgi:hypothetical protein